MIEIDIEFNQWHLGVKKYIFHLFIGKSSSKKELKIEDRLHNIDNKLYYLLNEMIKKVDK